MLVKKLLHTSRVILQHLAWVHLYGVVRSNVFFDSLSQDQKMRQTNPLPTVSFLVTAAWY